MATPANVPRAARPLIDDLTQGVGVVGLSILAAITYGILHDQITARICVEYFTIGHVRLIDSDSPTVLGLFWGVVATWWVGLPLGVGLAFAARWGRRPPLSVAEIVEPLGRLLAIMFGLAFLAGLTGFLLARAGTIQLMGSLAERVPPDRHVAFLTCGWSHAASYLSGLVGGVALWIWVWRARKI